MKKLYLALVFLVCLQHFTKAQDGPGSQTAIKAKLNETLVKFAKHAVYHPVEKIYLHLNKPWYNRADTIWFKLYTVTGNNKPTDLSEVAYVSLVDNRDSVLQHINLKLQSGMAPGNIALPLYLTPGIYHLKAYTNWMRNQDESYLFDRAINIGGLAPTITPSATLTTSATAPSTDIQFFPEGGVLVNDLRSLVAFKAIDPDGSPANITGKIIASDGAIIADIKSGHDGMGVFALLPQSGKTYRAVVQSGNQPSQTTQLPASTAEGYTLIVNRLPDTLSVIIKANPQLFKNKAGHGFYLVAQAAGKIVYSVSSPLITPVADLDIPTTRLPSGITRLTLFSEAGEPLQERVVFIQGQNNINMSVKTGKDTYETNEKVKLAINAGTMPANLSAAVINETLAPADEATEPTILSQLLLSSELHGAINDPAYYFMNKDEKTLYDLDMLMLTQGYRKLEWKKLLDTVNKVSPFFAEGGLSISGTVKTPEGKPVIKGNVSLLAPIYHIFASAITDSAGRFIFSGINITDTASVVLKASTGKNDNNVDIILDKPGLMTAPLSYFNTPPAMVAEVMKQAYINQQNLYPAGRELKEVNIKDKKLTGNENAPWIPALNHSDNLNGAGHANQVILGKDLGDCICLTDCLSAKIAGIKVYEDGQITEIAKGHYSQLATMVSAAKIDNTKRKTDVNPEYVTDRQPFEIIVDGTQVEPRTINFLNVDNIYSVEVLRSGTYKNMYGTDAYGGVLLITTKRGGDFNDYKIIKKAPGMINYVFNGYEISRTFYTPKYNAVNNTIPRSAIYWNPDIITDKNGNASLEYNNAGKGNYRMVIEGIDNDGNIGRFVYRYKVE